MVGKPFWAESRDKLRALFVLLEENFFTFV